MAKNFKNKRSASSHGGGLILLLFSLFTALFVISQQTGLLDELMDSFQGKESEISVFSSSSSLVTEPTDGTVRVHFIDVGQGDSELIQIPKADGFFNILIDAGVKSNSSDLVTYLQNQNISTLDVVIATHPHADHIGGMTDVIKNFKVSNFYMPLIDESQTPTTKTYEKMLDALIDGNIPTHEIYAGAYIDLPVGSQIQVIAPNKDEKYSDLNNYSAVLRFSHRKNSFLFTGDAEKESEEIILNNSAFELSSTVLKVGHHGSSTSTTKDFLEAVSPLFAVISCEKDNSYGHPHRETMSALNDFGCEILRTDEVQTIIFESDGKNLAVYKNLASAR